MTHRRRQNYYALPTEQWQRLAAAPFNLLGNLERVDDAIDANADIADAIVNTTLASAEIFNIPPGSSHWHGQATASDLDKARSTIRQFYRDWSADGINERIASNSPILDALERRFPDRSSRKKIRVLVPGAGLGRLVFDIYEKGFAVEGNEISYHQLMGSNWVLNHIQPGALHRLYPFALEFSNLLNREHQLRMVQIPDVNPVSSVAGKASEDMGQMSMSAGDFISVYGLEGRQGAFDVVATVFFIDTAPNVIKYIETVRHCLKEGGLWLNYGPLLWHFAQRSAPDPDRLVEREDTRERTGIEAPGTFELTDSEMLALLDEMGFKVETHQVKDDGQGYIRNPDSMLQNTYRCSHWIARKNSR